MNDIPKQIKDNFGGEEKILEKKESPNTGNIYIKTSYGRKEKYYRCFETGIVSPCNPEIVLANWQIRKIDIEDWEGID